VAHCNDVAIVTPAYNAAEFITSTLASVVAQTIGPVRHVVVDDGSKDDTRRIVAEFAERNANVTLITQQNAGPAAARNRGLAELGPEIEFVAFLDHDDEYVREGLHLLRGALIADPDAVAVYGDYLSIDGSGALLDGRPRTRPRWFVPDARRLLSRRSRRTEPPEGAPTTYEIMAYWCAIQSPSLGMVRRSIIDRIGGFDPTLPITADYDFWLRVARCGPIVYLPEVVTRYRWHETQMSENDGGMRRDLRHTHLLAIAADVGGDRATRSIGRQQIRHFEFHRAIDKVNAARDDLGSRRFRSMAANLARSLSSLWIWMMTSIPSARLQRFRLARSSRRRSEAT
jgi:glycosyltransferase involved in cell wall biosynthesis